MIQLSQQMAGIQIVTTFGSDFLELLNMHSVLLGLSLAYMSALLVRGDAVTSFRLCLWRCSSTLLFYAALLPTPN